ncbi:unnamed protein product [Blumeria hordei]|uniref:RING-CH-type domain-containing protein n=1 Tax=Blumeria hordei TaxID=2867405 RepID=A0A383UTH0_BLUHO|nr:unnamed protein product [Blumeria hordei]
MFNKETNYQNIQNDNDDQTHKPVNSSDPSGTGNPEYHPKTCRICLEEVHPSYNIPNGAISGLLHPKPEPQWVSEDPKSGRLIRPCRCRGTQKYVHEGCLQLWRLSNTMQAHKQNFWECPTCKFKYRLERMAWSRMITSPLTRIGITILIVTTAVFLLGFIADPIINLYLNPISTIATVSIKEAPTRNIKNNNFSWSTHFLKGFASIGIFGILKSMLAMSSWQLLFRGFGVRTSRRRNHAAQDQLGDIPWVMVFIGACAFLMAVWSIVQAWTDLVMKKVGERVADVQGADEADADKSQGSESK